MWRNWWRHPHPYQNRYMPYVASVIMLQIHLQYVLMLDTRIRSPRVRFFIWVNAYSHWAAVQRHSVIWDCLSVMTQTLTRDSHQTQPFLIPQVMCMCGTALWNVWVDSWSFTIRACSGKHDWHIEQSKPDVRYCSLCRRLLFNDSLQKITHNVSTTGDDSSECIFAISSSIWHKL